MKLESRENADFYLGERAAEKLEKQQTNMRKLTRRQNVLNQLSQIQKLLVDVGSSKVVFHEALHTRVITSSQGTREH
jgi:hypothetical protein